MNTETITKELKLARLQAGLQVAEALLRCIERVQTTHCTIYQSALQEKELYWVVYWMLSGHPDLPFVKANSEAYIKRTEKQIQELTNS